MKASTKSSAYALPLKVVIPLFIFLEEIWLRFNYPRLFPAIAQALSLDKDPLIMKLDIPEGRFSAYLFDCDGTIANSLPVHLKAWNTALAEWGTAFPEEEFYAWGGIPVPRTVEMLNEKLGLAMNVSQVTASRERAYHALIESVESHAAVEAIIHRFHGKIPMAVVSGSPRASVEKTLRQLDLWPYFDVIVGAEDVKAGKPHPEPYLTAARLLAVDPATCLVFEDAEPGIQSAIAAGMKYVRIPQRPDPA